MFEIGQQVVCISEVGWVCVPQLEPTPAPFPAPKQVYTISGFHEEGRDLFLLLEEMRGAWFAKCFRPVRKTSIETFRELLVRPNQPLVDA